VSGDIGDTEYLVVDDNNSHDGKGPRHAVIRKTSTSWSVLEVDEGFQSDDKVLQGLIDMFNNRVGGRGPITFVPSRSSS
jgi:hypothetical protein